MDYSELWIRDRRLAVITVWCYFFFVELLTNLTVSETFLGETTCNRQVSEQTVSYYYCLENVGAKVIVIGNFSVKNRWYRFMWFFCL